MKQILRALSWIGILLTILPAIFYGLGTIELKPMQLLMTIGMVLWFIAAPIYQSLKTRS